MANETSLTVVGNLTGDPELKYTTAGVAMAKFTVASTPRVFDRATGQYKDGEALFISCTVWREMAEHTAESLRKGLRVVVTGRLRLSRWETEEGEKRSAYGLDVDEVGPSLRFATAAVKKATRTGARDGFVPDQVPDELWDSAAPAGMSHAA
ncbi:single-stranded DNA-binding protein [Luedemannella helvata]|uniref:Single-stranded DNA-binding protein n=1 Tax=Luedemannella helvata TaxID=349315 RepID=A0ABP4X439_9ACTN